MSADCVQSLGGMQQHLSDVHNLLGNKVTYYLGFESHSAKLVAASGIFMQLQPLSLHNLRETMITF